MNKEPQWRLGLLVVAVPLTVFWTLVIGYCTKAAGVEPSAVWLAIFAADVFAFTLVVLAMTAGLKSRG